MALWIGIYVDRPLERLRRDGGSFAIWGALPRSRHRRSVRPWRSLGSPTPKPRAYGRRHGCILSKAWPSGVIIGALTLSGACGLARSPRRAEAKAEGNIPALPARWAYPTPVGTRFWTTFQRMMPISGMYHSAAGYGGTRPLLREPPGLGGAAVLGSSRGRPGASLLVRLKVAGTYHVWVRRYGGYGEVAVRVDDRALVRNPDPSMPRVLQNPGRGCHAGAARCYSWFYLGAAVLAPGERWIDIDFPQQGIYDAIVFTRAAREHPSDGALRKRERIDRPVQGTFRRYRAARLGAGGQAPFVVAESIYGHQHERVDAWRALSSLGLKGWGAAGELVHRSFQLVAGANGAVIEVTLGPLCTAGGRCFGGGSVRVARPWPWRSGAFDGGSSAYLPVRLGTQLLVRDERPPHYAQGAQGGPGARGAIARLGPHENRLLVVSVAIPTDAPAGSYRAALGLQMRGGAFKRQGWLELQVLPLRLPAASGRHAIFYPFTSDRRQVNPQTLVSHERYLGDLRLLRRLGLNGVPLVGPLLRGGVLNADAAVIRHELGGSEPLLVMGSSGNPGPRGLIALFTAAQRLGFAWPHVIFYHRDEPQRSADLRANLKDLEGIAWREAALGRLGYQGRGPRVQAMVAFTTAREDYFARHIKGRRRSGIAGWVDRPLLNAYNARKEDISYVKRLGARPVSYWVTGVVEPLQLRQLAGFWSAARGFVGTMPWAYSELSAAAAPLAMLDPKHMEDATRPAMRLGLRNSNTLAYPDQAGQPIATRAALALGEGITDARYLQLLRQTLLRHQRGRPSRGSPLGRALATGRALVAEILADDAPFSQAVQSPRAPHLMALRCRIATALLQLEAASRGIRGGVSPCGRSACQAQGAPLSRAVHARGPGSCTAPTPIASLPAAITGRLPEVGPAVSSGLRCAGVGPLKGARYHYAVQLEAGRHYVARLDALAFDAALVAFPAAAGCAEQAIAAACGSARPPFHQPSADDLPRIGAEMIAVAPLKTERWIIAVTSAEPALDGRAFRLGITEDVPPANGRCTSPHRVHLKQRSTVIHGSTQSPALQNDLAGITCASSRGGRRGTSLVAPAQGPQLYYRMRLRAGRRYRFALDARFDSALYAFPASTPCAAAAVSAACGSSVVAATGKAPVPCGCDESPTRGGGCVIPSTLLACDQLGVTGGQERIVIAPRESSDWVVVVDSWHPAVRGEFSLRVSW